MEKENEDPVFGMTACLTEHLREPDSNGEGAREEEGSRFKDNVDGGSAHLGKPSYTVTRAIMPFAQ